MEVQRLEGTVQTRRTLVRQDAKRRDVQGTALDVVHEAFKGC